MRTTKQWRKSTGCIALLVSIASSLAQGAEPAEANRVANDQWSFAVAERRMQEIHAIGAQLTALSREALPTGLSAAERTESARFTHWLYNSSRKFHHLARGWGAFLKRVPRSAAANPTQQERLQEMNRSFSLRYLNMVSSATDEVQAFRFDNPALRTRHEKVVRLIAHLQ